MLFAENFMVVPTLFLLTLVTKMILFGFIWLIAIVYQFYSIAAQLLN